MLGLNLWEVRTNPTQAWINQVHWRRVFFYFLFFSAWVLFNVKAPCWRSSWAERILRHHAIDFPTIASIHLAKPACFWEVVKTNLCFFIQHRLNYSQSDLVFTFYFDILLILACWVCFECSRWCFKLVQPGSKWDLLSVVWVLFNWFHWT